MVRTHFGAISEELQPVERTHAGEVNGELSPIGRTPRLDQGKSKRSPPPEGVGSAETMCDKLIPTPISYPLCPWEEGGRENQE